MEWEYVDKIKQVFYLKENQSLTQDEIETKLFEIIREVRNESYSLGRRSGITSCKVAIESITR